MEISRPAVSDGDSTLAKIVKYIPGEIIAGYTAIAGILTPAANFGPTELDISRYKYILLFLVVVTPIWTYISVLNSNDVIVEPPSRKKRAFFHACIATCSFMIWVYALGDILFRASLCKHCVFVPNGDVSQQAASLKNFMDCLNSCKTYDYKIGAIVLILFTVIAVPLLEWFILKKALPITKTLISNNSRAQDIIDECERNFETYKADCSGFVKSVATRFDTDLEGQADNIVDQIKSTGWSILPDGKTAKQKADEGWLVVVGLKARDHNPPRNNGHVAVIVSGPLARDKYPTAYWGTLGSIGRKKTTINYAWKDVDRDNVTYSGRIV
jgi:hypothetical protein